VARPPVAERVTARVVEVGTPTGTARAHVRRPRSAIGTFVLGHGAGGGVGAADLVAVAGAAVAAGWAVALVEQPWRVAGRRVAAPPPRLDEAWVPVLRALRSGRGALPGPLVTGGRSAGARVACRTGDQLGAAATVCLAFPLHPPGRPERSRAPELGAAVRPLLVVQGERDAFGGPAEVREVLPEGAELVAVPGTHALDTAAATAAAADAVAAFLSRVAARPE
jgi:predicted alpha/beta-hydrolase family hydrolase